MNVYLIRHGESTGNYTKKIQGSMDFPLSKLGKKQVEAISHYLASVPLDYIYSSDLSRAHHTARAIAKKQRTKDVLEVWDEVREVYLGPFQGLTRAEIYEKYPETKQNSILTSGVHGTETIASLTTRCANVKKRLMTHHAGEHVAIVSHGGFISIFLMYILIGEKWHTFHRPFQIDNTSITHVEWRESEQLMIHTINNTCHLEKSENTQSNVTIL